MKLFLDANILVSVLNKEYPLFTYTARILTLTDKKGFEVFTSPVCLAIAFYFAEKKHGTVAAKKKIKILCEHIGIAANSTDAVLSTLSNKKIGDFEDGLEYYSALETNCTCIITEDIGDYFFSEIEVLGAEQFFVKYMAKQR